MNKHITLLKMKNAIKRVMKGKLKFIYDSEHGCFYIQDGCPSCLIGCALHDLGVKKTILSQLDKGGRYNIPCAVLDDGFARTLALNSWSIDYNALQFAAKVQDYQDEGVPWNQCYEVGLKSLDE